MTSMKCVDEQVNTVNNVRAPSRTKVVWGFARIAQYVTSYIQTSQFIPTEQKDQLVNQLHKLVAIVSDAETRARGRVPLPPSIKKKIFPQPSTSKS